LNKVFIGYKYLQIPHQTKATRTIKGFKRRDVGDIAVSSITVAELSYGVAKSHYPQQNHPALEQFLAPLVIAPFSQEAAQQYGHVRAYLERQGTSIGALDLLIAAQHKASKLHSSLTIRGNSREYPTCPLKIGSIHSYLPDDNSPKPVYQSFPKRNA